MTTEATQRARKAHHKALEALKKEVCGQSLPGEGKRLWRELRAIERLASQAAEDLCSVEGAQQSAERHFQLCQKRVSNLFGGVPPGFFINRDPRGYALKLDNEERAIPEGMHKDWGGYGILAPPLID